MKLPEGIKPTTYYELSLDSLVEGDDTERFIGFDIRSSFRFFVMDRVLGIGIVIRFDSEKDIEINILDGHENLHQLNSIAHKLVPFVRSNLKEYTIKEYMYIADTITTSIREAPKPILEFELYTSTAKRAYDY